ncbi:deazaflavin-dependent oxidoreductase (nitroreductase family) [Williamsia limnetica]|uniref:Deazaflavin-dependent oxidoreductase (Nitroreductase family) n=1 Tax=Williamsia limnetica TaxID=882452 RepID=A0A318RGW3_WILLI|nr:nitroreductase family deazaflavin-dependent oxidoreductase [Williamsia limnetica]PYE12473.1 deazaflavin-dependent oxidoreductase (nitroreductase family) [Williamsia limnetica]
MSPQKPKRLNSRATLIITRYASRFHTFAYRASRGRLGKNLRIGAAFRKPAPTLLLDHVGRKTGKTFTTPLLYMADGSDVIVVASAGGRDEHPQWYRNLIAHPQTHITIGSRRRSVRAHLADPRERARLWPHLVETYADFDSYQQWTDREIPVIVLESVATTGTDHGR